MEGQPAPLEGTGIIPARVENVEEARFLTSSGEPYWIIHQKGRKVYLRLDEGDYFLWSRMDGPRAEPDLIMAYFQRFGTFPLERMDILLKSLSKKGFLLTADGENPPFRGAHRRFEKIAESFWQIEIPLPGADSAFSRIFRATGWIFLSRPFLLFLGVVCIAGTTFFLLEEPLPSYPLFFEGNSFFAGIIWVYLALIVSAVLHECGHAFACKAYGRKVNAAGIVFYYGFPCLYVDTSDIWMADRNARIAVSLAGPAVNLVIGALFSFIVFLAPDHALATILWRIAFLSFLLFLVNLNPLLELDGYYVLEDLLEISNLREKSFSFIRNGTWLNSIPGKKALNHREWTYLLFGMSAGMYTILTVLVVIYIWESHVSDLVLKAVHGTLPEGDFISTIFIILILIPFMAGLVIKSMIVMKHIIERGIQCFKKNDE